MNISYHYTTYIKFPLNISDHWLNVLFASCLKLSTTFLAGPRPALKVTLKYGLNLETSNSVCSIYGWFCSSSAAGQQQVRRISAAGMQHFCKISEALISNNIPWASSVQILYLLCNILLWNIDKLGNIGLGILFAVLAGHVYMGRGGIRKNWAPLPLRQNNIPWASSVQIF